MDANEAIQVWLDSPPHRQNMLDPTWREVGIGSLHAAFGGRHLRRGSHVGDHDGLRHAKRWCHAAKPSAIVNTAAAHKTVATKAKKAKKAGKVTKAGRWSPGSTTSRSSWSTKRSRRRFTPPLTPKNTKPGDKPKTKVEAKRKGKSKPKKPGTQEDADPHLAGPQCRALRASRCRRAPTRTRASHHYGDDEQGDGADDPGTPPEAPPPKY